jgi:hypothetical protein
MRKLRDSRGQTVVLTVVFITALFAMTGFVLDVGSWYRAHRAAQATADASALAAAQALPYDRVEAKSVAMEYGDENGGGVASVTFSQEFVPDDTVTVKVEREAPGLFARIFGIGSVSVGAEAVARATAPATAQYVAPVVVNINHEFLPGGLGCDPLVCDPQFNSETELPLLNLHESGSGDAAGAFGLIDLRGGNGSVGAEELAGWMLEGFDQNMPLGIYNSVPSVKFNSSHFRDALAARLNTEILIPIYDTLVESGSNAEYNVIGWVGFVPTSFRGGGSNGNIVGYFTRVVWAAVAASSANQPGFGVRTISLVG